MTAYKQVVASWNAQADETNQWDSLGEDEKIEWALKCADQFRGATKMMQAVLHQLITATELHHLNPLDLENLSRYNQAKCNAKQAIGLDT